MDTKVVVIDKYPVDKEKMQGCLADRLIVVCIDPPDVE